MSESKAPGVLAFDLDVLAETRPDFQVLTFDHCPHPDETVSYADLVGRGRKLARALGQQGFTRGDTLALLMRNHSELVVAMYAASALGVVLVPIDPRSRGDKLSFQLRDSGSKGVIYAAELAEEVNRALRAVPEVKTVGVLYKDDFGVPVSNQVPSLNEILGGPEAPALAPAGNNITDPYLIIYTSGTTGNPKGVTLRNDRLLAYVVLAQLAWGYGPEDRLYTGLSLTHGNAHAVTLTPSLLLSIPAVISRKFTKSRIWDVCRAYGCTTFSLLGGMMMGIYSEPARPDDADNPVRKVISAGTPAVIWEEFERRFEVKIHEWYAAVEGGFAHKPPGEGPVGSFGKPLPGIMEMKVVREDDSECEPGEPGELISRLASGETTVEYRGNEKASRDKTRGGWLRSGDIVRRDEQGWFFFLHRKGGGLRRQGDFIQPESVEKVIAERPEVSDVCVYGIPAATGAPGESDLVAAVVAAPESEVDIKALFAACIQALGMNSVPTYVQVVEEIPKTISEKNLDRVLRERFDPEAEGVYRLKDYRQPHRR